MGAITLIRKTPLGNRMILKPAPVNESPGPGPLDHLIGKAGVSQTLMMPGGIVLIDGERLHSESLGMLIEPNSPIVAVAIRGNRVVVRPWTPSDSESNSPPGSEQITAAKMPPDLLPGNSSEPNPLDFDFPQG